MSWSKGFDSQVRNPVTELIVMRRDKAAPLAVKGMENLEGGVSAVAEFREVWRI